MAPPRRRRRRARSSRLERAGYEAWDTVRELASAALRPLAWCSRQAWSGFCRQRAWIQICVVATAALVGLGAYARDTPLSVDREVEALARVLRSEIGHGSQQERVHIAWITRNLAAERGESIAEMACSPCGPQKLGRPVSSRQEATDADRELARAILDQPAILDPTGGATHFINPRLQDELARRRVPGYVNRSYRRVEKQWRGYAWRPYYRLSDELEVWGEVATD